MKLSSFFSSFFFYKSTIKTVVLTADVFQLFYKILRWMDKKKESLSSHTSTYQMHACIKYIESSTNPHETVPSTRNHARSATYPCSKVPYDAEKPWCARCPIEESSKPA